LTYRHFMSRPTAFHSQALVSGNFFLPRYYIYYKVRNRSFVKNLGHRVSVISVCQIYVCNRSTFQVSYSKPLEQWHLIWQNNPWIVRL
jgi:hypothetical protein